MRKQFYAIAFLLFLTVSCVSDKIESEEDRISRSPEAVWEYNGDIATLDKVIQELKNSPNREKLERRLLKNDVLWEEAKFILIEDKKRILVPFLSIDKENVVGVLSLVKDDEGKTTFDMIVRRDLINKTAQFPFWKRGIWTGYFMALDKDILGIKNGNPGLMIKTTEKKSILENKNTKTKRTVCEYVDYAEVCIWDYECTQDYGAWGEGQTYCTTTLRECYNLFTPYCYEVEDPIDPTPDPDPISPVDECNNAENSFDSSSGQSMDVDINLDVSPIDSYTREVTYTRQIFTGYGMRIYSVDSGVQDKAGNNWEWRSIKHEYDYPIVDSSLFTVTYTVNKVSAIVNNPNEATIEINYNVKVVLECGGAVLKTKDENHTSLSVKSPYINGD